MSIVVAAQDLVNFVKEKYNIKDTSEFTCPYMRKLAEELDRLDESAEKVLTDYEKLVFMDCDRKRKD
jgi:hypothetical protein